jgi:hypothetical protein
MRKRMKRVGSKFVLQIVDKRHMKEMRVDEKILHIIGEKMTMIV